MYSNSAWQPARGPSREIWHGFGPDSANLEGDVAQSAVPIPDADTMEGRWRFRDAIFRETDNHRRRHPHAVLGRSIVHILQDRERRGAAGIVHHRRRMRRKGDRSPATVFDSPNSTASSVYDHLAPVPVEKAEEHLALDGRVIYPLAITHEIRMFAEYTSTIRYHSAFLNHLGGDDEVDEHGKRPESSKAVSTISVAFSPDARSMASTHGDHTVKISCCTTGRLLQSLDGHPRTPWTVKYHPSDSRILASGCLGHQVRVWNWVERQCLQMIRLDHAIISVSFHPSGKLLAIANGTRLHFWGVDDPDPKKNGDSRLSAILSEIDQRHMLRCVHFPPNEKSIIIGGVNPTSEDSRRRQRGGIGGGGMSFYLRLWDFDLATALRPPLDFPATIPTLRRAISNPRTFVPRALLYNDGGFDVSPDGKTLCACAEYWLPEGVNSAMELMRKEEMSPEREIPYHDATPDFSCSSFSGHVVADTQSTVSAAFERLHGLVRDSTRLSEVQSPSFRDEAAVQQQNSLPVPRTPSASTTNLDYIPRTPPIPREQPVSLSPPSPPGRRFTERHGGREVVLSSEADDIPDVGARGISTPPPPPPPPAPSAPGGSRPPHPLSIVAASMAGQQELIHRGIGRYVPHVVTVSLDSTPLPQELEQKWPRGKHPGAVAKGYRPRLGQLLEACPLDSNKASAVTCVKFSPSTDFCLIGYGVREPEGGGKFHPVTALYRIRGGMVHVSTMLSEIDDVNIARFHPDSGYGFVYGTKQGRVRVLSPRPWNFYNC